MRSITRIICHFFGVIQEEAIADALDNSRGQYAEQRTKMKLVAMEAIRSLDATKDAEKIKTILTDMNRDIAMVYERELAMVDFAELLKR